MLALNAADAERHYLRGASLMMGYRTYTLTTGKGPA